MQESEGPHDQFLYLLDWFAPNKMPEIHKVFLDRDHGFCMIPGLISDMVQVNDTHGHQPFSAKYKEREVYSAMLQLQEGVKMPCVLIVQSWKHSKSFTTVLYQYNTYWSTVPVCTSIWGCLERTVASCVYVAEPPIVLHGA